jgi:hypothetical protein
VTPRELLAEVRRRAGDIPRPETPEDALLALTALGALKGEEAKAIRTALRAIAIQPSTPLAIDLDQLGPLPLAALERLLEGLVHDGLELRPPRKAAT